MSIFALAPDGAGIVERFIYWIVETGGLPLVALVIFAECGLLIGFFLPGDSLLFIAGYLASGPVINGGHIDFPSLWVVLIVLFPAAVLGDQVGYWVGRRVGPSLLDRPDSRLFKQAYVTRTQAFFDRNGPKAIILARFVPIVRTFTPVMAGVVKMDYPTFVRFNVVGGALWAIGVTTAGYFLGQIEVINQNVEYVLILVVLISLLPAMYEYVQHRRGARPTAPADDTA